MKNIDRLAKYITKYGSETLMVHTIKGTGQWLIAQKIEDDKWLISIEDPMGNATFNLGTVTDAQHYRLWMQLTIREVNSKLSQMKIIQELRKVVNNFLKVENYKKITDIKTNELRTHRSSKITNRLRKNK